MRSRGRLAPALAAITTATVLSMPAAADALGNAEEAATSAPASGQATAGVEPQPVGTDDTSAHEATGGVEVVRYVGADTYEQSLVIARATVAAKGGASEWVVLASGESWTHAAVAGPLAASLDAPVLLMPPGGLQAPTEHLDIADFLKSARITRAVVVGDLGPAPMHKPPRHFGSGMLPPSVEHVWGDGPAASSVAAARRLGAPADLGDRGRTVIIASDRSVADAVAVGPLAAAGPFPLLLTAPDALDPLITAHIDEHKITHAVLVGGNAAIAPAVQDAIEAAGVTVTRLAGRDRYETAELAAELFREHTTESSDCPSGPTRIGLAPAQHPEQAFTAGPLLASLCMPLRYTGPERLSPGLRNSLILAAHRPEGAQVVVFADEARIARSEIEASVPPALMAFEGGWPPDHPRHGEFAVVIVDERGRWRRYPVESDYSPGFDPEGWGSEVFEWSPDGRYLAYISARDHQLLIIDIETDRVRRSKLEGARLRFSRWHYPEWSPDSSLLAFSAFPVEEEFAEVFLFDAMTGSTTRLTYNDTDDEVLAWSPDNTSVAIAQAPVGEGFFSVAPYSSHLVVTDIGMGTTTSLYASPLKGLRVIWAPDGRHLAFRGWDDNLDTGLLDTEPGPRAFVVRSDGSGLQQVHPKPAMVWPIDWDPSGRRLLYSTNYSASHMPDQYWIRDLSTGKDTQLDFIHYGPIYPLGWSRDQREVTFLLFSNMDLREMLIHVDVETGDITPLLELQIDDRKRRTIGLSGDERQMAFVIDNERLIIVNASSPLGTDVIDFSAQIDSGPNDGCRGSWTTNGIRGSCTRWRDI